MQIDKNNWQIQITEENRKELEDYIASKYIDKEYVREISRVSFAGEFLTLHDYQIPFFTCYQKNSIPIITTDQFRKYILGKEPKFKVGDKVIINNKNRIFIVKSIRFGKDGIYYCFECGSTAIETSLESAPQKIIGYKAPFDMYGGKVKKGDILKRYGAFYSLNEFHDYDYLIPYELVEAYLEPVYEEEEKVIELHGYKITKDSIEYISSGVTFTKYYLLLIIESYKNNFVFYERLLKVYEEIIKAYEELNK